jgi:hypothetical protein
MVHQQITFAPSFCYRYYLPSVQLGSVYQSFSKEAMASNRLLTQGLQFYCLTPTFRPVNLAERGGAEYETRTQSDDRIIGC